MSFASKVKTELCGGTPQRLCCRRAECYGMLLFGRSFSIREISMTAGSARAEKRAAGLIAEIAETAKEGIRVRAPARGERNRHFQVLVSGEAQRRALLARFGHEENEISLRINHANLENECCPAAFLRGAFLSCGTVTDPAKDYHLEFVAPFRNLARDLASLIGGVLELDLQPGLLNRRGAFVVYVKGSEHVADLLTYLGAGNAAMELMQVKMLKEVRNNVNRKTNFETANLGKTAQAAAEQVLAIEKIKNTVGLSALPEELRELASLRCRRPELSLRELGEALSVPMSRSGVNHRLRRIVEIARGKILPGGKSLVSNQQGSGNHSV